MDPPRVIICGKIWVYDKVQLVLGSINIVIKIEKGILCSVHQKPVQSSNFQSPKKSWPYFGLPGLSWTSPDFPGLLLVFVEIMPDKVILDNKKSSVSF